MGKNGLKISPIQGKKVSCKQMRKFYNSKPYKSSITTNDVTNNEKKVEDAYRK